MRDGTIHANADRNTGADLQGKGNNLLIGTGLSGSHLKGGPNQDE
jgi:hypothetical protein